MAQTWLIGAALVQVGLTFVLLYWMGALRWAAVGRGEVRTRDVALREPAWPKRATQVGNCFHNQLELPLLFYALVAFLMVAGAPGALDALLAWTFVALRVAHAAVFVTTNHVRTRGLVYLAGAAVLTLHWAVFGVSVLARGA